AQEPPVRRVLLLLHRKLANHPLILYRLFADRGRVLQHWVELSGSQIPKSSCGKLSVGLDLVGTVVYGVNDRTTGITQRLSIPRDDDNPSSERRAHGVFHIQAEWLRGRRASQVAAAAATARFQSGSCDAVGAARFFAAMASVRANLLVAN